MKKLLIIILLYSVNSFAAIPDQIRGYWYWYKYADEGNWEIRRPVDKKVRELCYADKSSLRYADGREYKIKNVVLREDSWWKRSYDLYFYGLEGHVSVTLIKTAGSWSTIYRIGERDVVFYCIWIRKERFE